MDEWVKRWGYVMAATPSRPGIYKLEAGGFLIRSRMTDEKGKRHELTKVLRDANIQEAQAELDRLIAEKRATQAGERPQKQSFEDFATSLFEAKVMSGKINSAKGREKWEGTLRKHLLPFFGKKPCDKIRAWDVTKWHDHVAAMIAKGYEASKTSRYGKVIKWRIDHLDPQTANTWVGILRTIFSAMKAQLELDRDPGAVLTLFDTSQAPTYTDETPNSLTTEQAHAFLEAMRRLFPQHYAMMLLGFATGTRPSTLRPLRGRGPECDVDWKEGCVRFRRSHTRGNEFMVGTKTRHREKVALPETLLAVLKDHMELLADPPMSLSGKPPLWWRPAMAASDLLFPGRNGLPRSPSCLDKPFAVVSKEIGLPFPLTPRAMRRSFNDMARDAKVNDVVTRSITGHRTEKMQQHYSTARAEEQRQAIGEVVGNVSDLNAYKAARAATR